MKKLLLITGLMFALVGLAEAQLASPTLLTPTDAVNLPLKKSAKFTWQKVTGASKYRLIFSNDKSFANYDANKFKCLNAKTCFLYTVASPSYNVAATHALLKTDGNYFWQAQSVGKTTADNSKTGEIRAFSVGVKTTGYTKIANNGSELPDDAQLGTAPTDWACTQDNKTGLIWEIKTDNPESPLRFKDSMYTNYTADYPKCNDGGAGWCSTLFTGKYGDSTNTDGFVKAVNATNLCGKNDWRLPTVDELLGIVKSGSAPPIDTFYFPDIKSNYGFWSSSPYADRGLVTTLYVSFIDGHSYGLNKIGSNSVRLVR